MKKASSFAILLFFTASLLQAQGKTVVFPFENRSADSTVEWLGYGLEALFEDSLNGVPLAERLDIVDSMDVPDTGNLTLATRIIIAQKLKADNLLTGSFKVSENKILIEFTRYEIDKLTQKTGKCTVEMAGFPANLAPFIREEIGGKYPYPQTFTGHRFEAYVRGMLRAVVNSDFKEIAELAGKVTENESLNRNLGNLLFDTGHFEMALVYLKRLPETDSHGLFLSGMCCVQLENYADGLIFFLQTLKFRRNTASVVNVAGCLVALQHPVEAAAFLDSLPGDSGKTEPVVIFDRAVVDAGQKKWGDALNTLSSYISSFRITGEAKLLARFCCEKCNCTHPLCTDETEEKRKNQEKADIVSFYQFSNGEQGTNAALDLKEIKELYMAKAVQALKSGSKKEAIDALQKVLYLDPLQKDALKMLCEQCKDEKACRKLNALLPEAATLQ
ncbi:MAG: hypothetical protein GXO70_05705 [Acidobacteria bacterium]|nr:hypothetical protein [Acidobacteriota bacterium]